MTISVLLLPHLRMLSLLRRTTIVTRSAVRTASTRAPTKAKAASTVKAQAQAESAPPIIPDGAAVALYAELPSMDAVDAVESLIIVSP